MDGNPEGVWIYDILIEPFAVKDQPLVVVVMWYKVDVRKAKPREESVEIRIITFTRCFAA